MNLFKDIKIIYNSWSENCGWYFAYRNDKYGHEYSKTTPEIQIKIIEDMLNTMKRVKKDGGSFKFNKGEIMNDLDIADCIYDTLEEKMGSLYTTEEIEGLAREICRKLSICEKCGKEL